VVLIEDNNLKAIRAFSQMHNLDPSGYIFNTSGGNDVSCPHKSMRFSMKICRYYLIGAEGKLCQKTGGGIFYEEK